MHIVASRPIYVSREDVPADVVESERATYRQQAADSGKPAEVVDRIAIASEPYRRQMTVP